MSHHNFDPQQQPGTPSHVISISDSPVIKNVLNKSPSLVAKSLLINQDAIGQDGGVRTDSNKENDLKALQEKYKKFEVQESSAYQRERESRRYRRSLGQSPTTTTTDTTSSIYTVSNTDNNNINENNNNNTQQYHHPRSQQAKKANTRKSFAGSTSSYMLHSTPSTQVLEKQQQKNTPSSTITPMASINSLPPSHTTTAAAAVENLIISNNNEQLDHSGNIQVNYRSRKAASNRRQLRSSIGHFDPLMGSSQSNDVGGAPHSNTTTATATASPNINNLLNFESSPTIGTPTPTTTTSTSVNRQQQMTQMTNEMSSIMSILEGPFKPASPKSIHKYSERDVEKIKQQYHSELSDAERQVNEKTVQLNAFKQDSLQLVVAKNQLAQVEKECMDLLQEKKEFTAQNVQILEKLEQLQESSKNHFDAAQKLKSKSLKDDEKIAELEKMLMDLSNDKSEVEKSFTGIMSHYQKTQENNTKLKQNQDLLKQKLQEYQQNWKVAEERYEQLLQVSQEKFVELKKNVFDEQEKNASLMAKQSINTKKHLIEISNLKSLLELKERNLKELNELIKSA